MRDLRTLVIAALALLSASAAGCDPGYGYQPIDAGGKKVPQWSTMIAGVRFSADPYGTLIGSRNTFMRLGVANESKDEVEVLGGELETNGRTLKANLRAGPEHRAARTVPAGETKQVSLLVDFGGSASEVLGPSVTWVWRVRIGKAEHTLRVPMDRNS
jgi:hypothetical protein